MKKVIEIDFEELGNGFKFNGIEVTSSNSKKIKF